MPYAERRGSFWRNWQYENPDRPRRFVGKLTARRFQRKLLLDRIQNPVLQVMMARGQWKAVMKRLNAEKGAGREFWQYH